MYSDRGDAALPASGFPIRESAGQRLFSTSPRLIAAVHALHRLLVPRHPPCALTILTVIVDNNDARRRRGYNGDLSVVEQRTSRSLLWPCHAVFKVRKGRNRGTPGWSLKTQQYAPAPEGTSSRFGRRSRCASQVTGPGGRLSVESSLERR